jgi:hypothetical protein
MNTSSPKAPMLNHTTATQLAAELSAIHSDVLGRRMTGGHALTAVVEGDRIVFLGARSGSHSLCIDVSTRDRVRAHWDGYCSSVRNAEGVLS